MWNPSALTEKGKQTDDQRQPVGFQAQVRQGGGGGGREGGEGGRGAWEMRRTALAAGGT